MKFTINKKWLAGTMLSLISMSCAGLVWFKYQGNKGAGAYTELIDPSLYFEDYDLMGIKNVNILDPTASHFISNQDVVFQDGIIQSISSDQDLDSSIIFIDGTDKYLIPGLVDSHAHLRKSKNDLYLYLANGVTSIWEMFGIQEHLNWKEEKKNGSISPDLFVATSKVGSRKGLYHWGSKYFDGQINLTSVAAAKKRVRKFKKEGYDAVKLGSFVNREIYDSILQEAKIQNIPVLGHLPTDIGLEHMYESGLSELAHVEEIVKNIMEDFGGVGYDDTQEFITYLNDKVDSVAIKLRENNIAVSTTIFLMESLPLQKFDLENFLKTIDLDYVNPPYVEGTYFHKGWLPGNNGYENLEIKNDPGKRIKSELWWNTYVESIQIVTKALNKNKVILLAGSDANASGVVPGFSMHQELQSLVSLGLTNAEAIYSATVAPANWRSDNSGRIAEGYKANMVLLSANPLDDIKNTNTLEYLFSANYFLSKNQKDKMLSKIEEIHNQVRTIQIHSL